MMEAPAFAPGFLFVRHAAAVHDRERIDRFAASSIEREPGAARICCSSIALRTGAIAADPQQHRQTFVRAP